MTLQAHVVLCDMGLKHSSTSEERKLLLTSSRGLSDLQGLNMFIPVAHQ